MQFGMQLSVVSDYEFQYRHVLLVKTNVLRWRHVSMLHINAMYLSKEQKQIEMIMAEINSEGVHCLSGSCSEVYLEKAFCNAGLVAAVTFAKC